jgi:dihydroorotate dehydrogenase
MITLANGVSFAAVAAAGARGFAGGDEGHGIVGLWKKLFALPAISFISKTITLSPRKGNLTLWRPWRAVRVLERGRVVNAVGLTNPGMRAYVERFYLKSVDRRVPYFVSIAAETPQEAYELAYYLRQHCSIMAGLELNLSCPNVIHTPEDQVANAVKLFLAVQEAAAGWPVLVKLGVELPYVDVCRALANLARPPAVFDLINAVPWGLILAYLGNSPLSRYGYAGGVSGPDIIIPARKALQEVRALGLGIPILSGGGIIDAREATDRLTMGAGAIALGSVYLTAPWRVASIYKAILDWHKSQEDNNGGDPHSRAP